MNELNEDPSMLYADTPDKKKLLFKTIWTWLMKLPKV